MGDAYRDENQAAFEGVSRLRVENAELRAELQELRQRVVVVEHFFEITAKPPSTRRSSRLLAAVTGGVVSLGIIFAGLGTRAALHVDPAPGTARSPEPIERQLVLGEPPGPPVPPPRVAGRDPLAAARSNEGTRAAPWQPGEALDSSLVGVAECDRYLAKWNACYRDPALRAASRPAFDEVRASWRGMANDPNQREVLAGACARMVENFPTAACK